MSKRKKEKERGKVKKKQRIILEQEPIDFGGQFGWDL